MEKHYKWWLECEECGTLMKSQDEESCREGFKVHYRSCGHIATTSRILKR